MILENLTEVFSELGKAELNFKVKSAKFELTLLDLDVPGTQFSFNDSPSLSNYRNRILKLFESFKWSINQLHLESEACMLDLLSLIQTNISELHILLHPRCEDLLFAHMSLKGSTRSLGSESEINTIKKKPCCLSTCNEKDCV